MTSDPYHEFFNIGFHGDRYLIEVIDRYATESIAFIETGTNVGSTLAYMAGKYPFMKCLSCEPSLKAFVRAIENTDNLENVRLFNEDSDIFMRRIESYYKYLFKGPVLFWLDAHGQGSSWPLKSEVRFITTHFNRGYIFIDDFLVPGKPMFNHDSYGGHACSFNYIRDSIKSRYNISYPDYTERTSKHHPLVGWGLIEFFR